MASRQTTAASEPAIEQTALEQAVVAALGDAGTTSAQFYALASRVEAGIATSEQLAADTRAKAFDPEQSPSLEAARTALANAEFSVQRLRTLLPRLQLAAEKRRVAEEHANWVADYERLKVRVEAAADRFAEYPELATRIVKLITENEACKFEISQLHGCSPAGEARRLRTPEQIARNVPMDTPSILAELRLPDFSGHVIYPVPVQIDPAIFAPAPYDPRFSAEWHLVAAEQQRQRLEREQRELAEAERAKDAFFGRIPSGMAVAE